jgi:hypothetical protein
VVEIAATEYLPGDLLPEYLINQVFPQIASLISLLVARNL